MKIDFNSRLTGNDVSINDNIAHHPAERKSFSDMMKKQDEQATQEQLKQMVNQINIQGDRLARSMTIRELRQYRRMIREFLEETVRRGIVLKDTRGIDRRGRTKRYKLLDQIDDHLLQIAEELLQHEEGKIHILYHIGEIKGILVNFSF